MPRADKVEAVADIKERLESANAVFIAEHAGLSVKDQQVLRRALRSGGAEFRVVKMTLARLAAGQLDIQALDDLLLGPTGIAFANGDAVSAAKTLRDFSKDHDVFRIKGGLLGRDYLTPERVAELADIEPHEVLLSRMAAAFQAPMVKFAGLLEALPRGFATAMQQLLEDRQAAEPLQGVGDSGGPDDPAPPADDQASADAETAAAEQEPAAIVDAVRPDGAPTEDAAAAGIPEATEDGSEDAVGELAVDGDDGDVASADGVGEDVGEVSDDEPDGVEDAVAAPADEVNDEQSEEAVAKAEEE
jgi:large subunit ribosomal protein L10